MKLKLDGEEYQVRQRRYECSPPQMFHRLCQSLPPEESSLVSVQLSHFWSQPAMNFEAQEGKTRFRKVFRNDDLIGIMKD